MLKQVEKKINEKFGFDREMNIKVFNSISLAICGFAFFDLFSHYFLVQNIKYTIFSLIYILINFSFFLYINIKKKIQKCQIFMLIVNIIYLSIFYLYGGGFDYCVYYYFFPSIILTFILIHFSNGEKIFCLTLEIVIYSLVMIIDFLNNNFNIDHQTFMIENMMSLFLMSISLGLCFFAILRLNERQRSELQKLNKYLNQISVIDSLTGIWNRKYMDQKLNELKNSETLSIVMFDIDYFKKINDSYGHQVGDAILKQIAVTINSCLRYNDILTRYGGEEFLLILPNTTSSTAYALAEKIRKKIMNNVKIESDNRQITISGGVAALKDFKDIDSMIKHADDNLYYAKANGRNKICINKVK